MLYELHLTVEPFFEFDNNLRWVQFCSTHHVKPLLIELIPNLAAARRASQNAVYYYDGGQGFDLSASSDPRHGGLEQQLMFAGVHEGTDDSAAAWAIELELEAVGANFRVIRRKLEVPLDKSGVYTNPKYHECHVKAFVGRKNFRDLIDVCQDLGWYASRNKLYLEEGGLEKWYFTKRQYDAPNNLVASAAFRQDFSKLPTSLDWFVRMECETVLTDTNEALDDNWVKDYETTEPARDISATV